MTDSIQNFINATGIRFSELRQIDRNPNMNAPEAWMRGATHWKIVLVGTGREFTTYFSQGSAHTKEPTVADVLDCIASDASCVENYQTFEDFAAGLGYDPDSRKTERTFKTIQKQMHSLKRFLGRELYETLLWNIERL